MKMAFKDTSFSGNMRFNCHGRLMELPVPSVMGIINLTPDSFYSNSRLQKPEEVISRAGEMIQDGARILDLGACSTRPGSNPPSVEEEIDRLLPALKRLRRQFPDVILSVDTWRSEVVRMAIEEGGADMINDISAGMMDPSMIPVVAKCHVPYVIMHMQGTPDNMQLSPEYHEIDEELLSFFRQKTKAFLEAGINDLILDPGFGFGKTLDHNYSLLARLNRFQSLGFPVMAGISRKSMIYRLLETSPEDALNGTTAVHVLALLQGVQILRVHDVKEAVEAIRIVKQFAKSSPQHEARFSRVY